MHILERYALSCGVKIDKPQIYTKFYPNNFGKYITLQASSGMESKNYDFYQEVVEILSPHLKQLGIEVLQIGSAKDKRLNNVPCVFDASIPQMAYLIQNSVLHLGNDSCGIHFASGFDKKIVFLNSICYEQNIKPYWSDKSKYRIIEPERKGKPSFNPNEKPKQINKIKPEQVAQAVLDLLGINESVNLNTFTIGSDYLNKNVSVIPNCVFNTNLPFVISRLDKEYNQEVLVEQLKVSKVHIITNRPIHPDILNQFKQDILSVTYMLEKENQPNFIQFLKRTGIAYNLISELEGQDFEDLKLDYIDYGVISQMNKPKKEDFDFSSTENLKYVSSKNFVSNNKIYPSLAAVKADKPIEKVFDSTPQDVIDDPEFWRQAESFYFLTND